MGIPMMRGWERLRPGAAAVAVAVIVGSGCSDPELPLSPVPNDGCPFGSEPGFVPISPTLSTGDSVLLISGSRPAFSICFPGITFAVTWEARPDSSVDFTSVSDSTAWAHGRFPGDVLVTARLVNDPNIFGVLMLKVE